MERLVWSGHSCPLLLTLPLFVWTRHPTSARLVIMLRYQELSMKSRSILLCSSLFLFTIPALAQDCRERPRLITVTGTAEIGVAPDEAIPPKNLAQVT